MKKDEIIQLLKKQLDRAMKDYKELLQRIYALLERISSLEEALSFRKASTLTGRNISTKDSLKLFQTNQKYKLRNLLLKKS
jgi:hypothetical protein